MVVTVLQADEYTESHLIVHFKRVNLYYVNYINKKLILSPLPTTHWQRDAVQLWLVSWTFPYAFVIKIWYVLIYLLFVDVFIWFENISLLDVVKHKHSSKMTQGLCSSYDLKV